MDGGLVGQLTRGQNQRRGGTSSLRRDRVVVQDRTEDSGKEMSPLPKHGRNIWVMENRSRMAAKRERTRVPTSNSTDLSVTRHETERRRQRYSGNGHIDG